MGNPFGAAQSGSQSQNQINQMASPYAPYSAGPGGQGYITNQQRDQMVSQFPNGGDGATAFLENAAAQNAQNKATNMDPTQNPWADPANQAAIGKGNGGFLPDNYFVAGAHQVAVTPDNPNPMLPGVMGPLTKPSTQVTSQQLQGSSYPAMANSFGLGSQPTASPSAQPATMASPVSPSSPAAPNAELTSLASAITNSGSKGMNPWSLSGEANARDGAGPPQQASGSPF